MLKRLFITVLLLTLPASLWAAMAPVDVENANTEFDCPFLHDKKRLQLGEMTQGTEGWFFRIKADLKEHFELLPTTKEYLVRLNRAFAEQGAELVFVPIPTRGLTAEEQLNPTDPAQMSFNYEETKQAYQLQLNDIQTAGIRVVNLLDVAQKREPATDTHFFYKRDLHWTDYGSELTAKTVADSLKNTNFPKEAVKEFITKPTEQVVRKNSITNELRRLCNDHIPYETIQLHRTSAKTSGRVDALFGGADEPSAPIVLLGSSFSAKNEFHFAGFLSQYTGLDVANFAMGGGLLYNAITSYTSLPKEKRLNPQYVLWEGIAYYDLNKGSNQFRQIIPAIKGECSADDALASNSYKVDNGKSGALLKIPATLNAKGHSYFLYIHADNRSLNKFTIEMDHKDGDGEWFTIDRSEHFNNTGRFFIELSDEINTPLETVKIDGMPNVDATLDVRLCKQA